MKQKKIAVLAKSRAVLGFLEDFFGDRKPYGASYFSHPEDFIEHIDGGSPAAVVVESPFLQSVSKKIAGLPAVSVISGRDVKKDIENTVRCDVRSYIYKPFLAEDLGHKLESEILDKHRFNKMKNDARELEAVVDLTQLILATLDPKELLFKIVTKITEIIPVTRCSIIKADWFHRSAFVVASFENPDIVGIKLSLRKYPEIMEALKSKKPVIIRDIETDPIMRNVRDVIAPLGIRSILVLPIFMRDKVIGTLFLRTSRSNHTFKENEIRLLNSLANAAAGVVYNAFLFEQVEDEKSRLEKLAITDYLTGIFNIRYFYHRIIEEFSRCQRYSQPISCLMVDIDHFKKINDTYGHKNGDSVLKEFAMMLKKHSRKSDVLARYGGEEFIFLLPQTPPKGALSEAERIRARVKKHRFRSLGNKAGLTVSIGVASYPHPKIHTHDDLITIADNALFSAKKRGRNQVTFCEK